MRIKHTAVILLTVLLGTSVNASMPIYGNWKNFSKKNGLPSDKINCVRVDGDLVWVGTGAGLALLEDGEWKTFGVEDGLAHPGVLSIDVSESGDVWIGTLGGLNRLSAGHFETFNQFNSGLPNDVIYTVACAGNDVWVATGGGAGQYDTYTEEWGIFTEVNAPMHEPWTYGVCYGDNKIWIAAWGGGIIEYQYETGNFRDYTDPDGEMEIDLFPDDGLVHDITTGVSYADGILWVATYFGMSRYDGEHWKGYFDHDSGLTSNFINFLRANGNTVFLCTDKGLSSFNGETWVNYTRNESGPGGKITTHKDGRVNNTGSSTGISHNYVLGVDFMDDAIWVATSEGLSRGTRIK